MIKSVVWASTIDYPDELSAVLFMGECNWSCGFCHNLTLTDNPTLDFYEDILPKLVERKEFVGHVVISGGECTLSKELESMIDTLNNEGFVVGIHSNGTNPYVLERVLPKISHIGMDIKTTMNEKYESLVQTKVDFDNILKSIELIVDSEVDYEFRTTVFPSHVDKSDCVWISEMLSRHGVDKYVIQQFEDRHVNTGVTPYSKNYLEEIVKECSKNINTKLRGY